MVMAGKNLYEIILESLPEGDKYRSTWLEMIRCFSSIERVILRRFAQEYNSSLTRYDVLTALALNRKGLTMGELASLLMVTQGNITGIISRLEQDKLVLKKASKIDRRIQSVKLSARGLRLWNKMHEDYDEVISTLLSGHSDAEIQSLVKSLKKTRIAVEKMSDSTDPDLT